MLSEGFDGSLVCVHLCISNSVHRFQAETERKVSRRRYAKHAKRVPLVLTDNFTTCSIESGWGGLKEPPISKQDVLLAQRSALSSLTLCRYHAKIRSCRKLSALLSPTGRTQSWTVHGVTLETSLSRMMSSDTAA